MFSVKKKRFDDSTGNMTRHIGKCVKKELPDNQKIISFAQGSTYSKGKLRFLLAMWISQCHRPYSIIEDGPLQDILKMLHAKVKIPSRKTLSRDVLETFNLAQQNVIQYLQVCFFYFFLTYIINYKIELFWKNLYWYGWMDIS